MSYQNLDANESIFFDNELEFVKAKTYDKKYPGLKATTLLPVSRDAEPWAQTINYKSYSNVGIAKIISDYATDLPRASVKAEEFTSNIRGIGNSYGYSLMEIRAAQGTGKPLSQKLANSAKQGNDVVVDNIAWTGDSDNGLVGLFDNTNITDVAPITGTWSGATSAQIIADCNKMLNQPQTLTLDVEQPDTWLLPIAQYSIIASTPVSTTDSRTILEFLKSIHPNLTTVDKLVKLAGAGVAGADLTICYKNDSDVLSLEIPQAFEQLPVQERGLEYIINCHSRCGGVLVYYPLACAKMDGI
ncbi:MAG: DUF2184 domain-containing protein [bacterium]|nr:DUF2184 domain-containing protein [bacterium]